MLPSLVQSPAPDKRREREARADELLSRFKLSHLARSRADTLSGAASQDPDPSTAGLPNNGITTWDWSFVDSVSGGPCTKSYSGVSPSVIFAPPVAWLPGFKQYRPGEEPDPEALIRAMAAEGVDATIMDPAPWPLNPFHGRHPLYRGVDPARALQFLACKRSADMIMSVFESSVLIPLLARRVVGFKPALNSSYNRYRFENVWLNR